MVGALASALAELRPFKPGRLTMVKEGKTQSDEIGDPSRCSNRGELNWSSGANFRLHIPTGPTRNPEGEGRAD
ncbi:MAG TPA: hypothetical protein VMW11_09795 [Candidatus Dormibacteraeota bacterium]|nr:hypothetical protein [Candidatus Dormibacteraeota bacterium]